MKTISQKYLLARKQADRFTRPVLESPAYVRKHLTPKVQIGILCDPAKPVVIEPAVHTAKSLIPDLFLSWLSHARA